MTDGSKYLPYSKRSGNESMYISHATYRPKVSENFTPVSISTSQAKSQSSYTRANLKALT